VTLGFVLLALGAFVYAVLMALRYSLALPAAVLEDLPARKALRRSIDLSKGSRGRIFVLGLLISVIQIGLAMVTQIFFIVALFVAVKHHTELPVWVQILQQIVGFFTNSFIGPMYATGLTLFYYDQRIRKEGFDIERMMEAAGMTPPAIPAVAPYSLLPWPEALTDEPDQAPQPGRAADADDAPPESPHG